MGLKAPSSAVCVSSGYLEKTPTYLFTFHWMFKYAGVSAGIGDLVVPILSLSKLVGARTPYERPPHAKARDHAPPFIFLRVLSKLSNYVHNVL